ncbi:predicted protein [Bradyrhizobium cosmicum]|uniref:Uncharacterized protein n=1 Tax=Bradyrhizobium cosmicum TaxID=1404864 RepID=A0AAI8MJ59_9BRAD|nr:predicted protein [Bradyrhizobium cosmicum]
MAAPIEPGRLELNSEHLIRQHALECTIPTFEQRSKAVPVRFRALEGDQALVAQSFDTVWISDEERRPERPAAAHSVTEAVKERR